MKWISLVFLCFFSSCYSFRGISIDPTINTFSIEPIVDHTFAAPVNYPLDFADELNSKIRKESRLISDSKNPDLIFKLGIREFAVSPQAPIAGSFAALNRLNVTIEVESVNTKFEKQNWNQRFSYYEDFDAATNFNSVQDELLKKINKKLLDDIFNRAFTNW
ncbi:MAG: hypothetical protein LKG19_04245 [Saprospiraceae bacterium]|jgi:hypothetical protein|nr:hypothetical protein [Saprospiraceae bacterium]MCI1265764.1 hypothetical protein [Saprospiraceae bacterium]